MEQEELKKNSNEHLKKTINNEMKLGQKNLKPFFNIFFQSIKTFSMRTTQKKHRNFKFQKEKNTKSHIFQQKKHI